MSAAPKDVSLYDLFWENSKLSAATAPGFARRIEGFTASGASVTPLLYAAANVPLERPADGLASVFTARRSERAFGDRPLSTAQVGRLCSAFAADGTGSRPYASAGALYTTEVFALLVNVDGPFSGKAVLYDADRHALTPVAPLPDWERVRPLVNMVPLTGVPAIVFLFVVFPERATAKYGERGGRFALLEVGHAAQCLALRLAAEGIAGCEAGGLLDDEIRRLLGLERTGAQVALGYVCGGRAGASRRGRLFRRR